MQPYPTAWLYRIGVLMAAIALPAGTAAAQDEEDSGDPGADDGEVVEEIVVTGTRLSGGDPTARR